MTKVLALDFDGVITDNSNEYFFLVYEAYNESGRRIRNKEETKTKLRIHRPLLKTAKDFYSILRLLEENRKVSVEEINKTSVTWKRKRNEFSKNYFKAREQMIRKNRNEWFKLYRTFPWLNKSLMRLSRTHELFISTSRDRSSVYYIVKRLGIPIKRTHILSKEIAWDKIKHMGLICKKTGCKPTDILFVDDSIEQIKHVQKSGTRIALAAWGFVSKNQIREAENLGIPVLKPHNFESQVKRLI